MANPWDFVETKPNDREGSPTYTDYGRLAQSSFQAGGAQMASAAKYISTLTGNDEAADYYGGEQRLGNIRKEQTLGQLSPEAHDRLAAAVTSGKFWEHPFSAAALKTSGQTAQLLAMTLPGGVVSGAVRATATAALAGGAINSAQVIDGILESTGRLDDKELQEQSPTYKGMRSFLEEKDARKQLESYMLGSKPALAFLIGAVGNSAGAGGIVARGGVAGAAEKGILSRTASGAAEGATVGAAQGGADERLEQTAKIEGGLQKEYDQTALANEVLGGGLMGAGMAAPLAAAFHGKPSKTKEVTPKVTEEAPTDTHAQQSTGRTGYASPPDVNAAPPNPQNAPTGSERVYDKTPTPAVGPKGEAIKAKSKKAKTPAVDTPIEIPPDQAAALKARAPAVEAVSDRQVANELAEQHAPASPPEPVQPPTQQVPPDVAAASQRVAERAPPVEPAQAPVPEPTAPATPPPEVAAASKAVAQRAQERTEAPPTPAATKPRVLQDKSAEAKAVREQQSEFDKNKFREEKTEQKAGERLSHDTAAEKEKIEADRAHAKELFTKHAPTPAEADFMSEDRTKAKASRKAILDRVSAIINEAAERGIDLKQRVHTSQSDEMAWLTEANSLLGKTKTKLGPIQKHYVQFKTRDNDYRSGAAEAARAERKSEGDAARRVDQGDVEEAKPAAHVELPAHESPEDILARKQEHSELRSEKEVYEEGRERKVVRPAEFSAGKNQAGKFKVETVKRPNITPKVKAVQEKVATKVNTNPSEAQKEAGNYAKTHINVDGLNLSIENPKGSTRSGIGPDGKRWEVVMPDHYGYIKRTEGADGDHVDITYNGKGEHVFVIDQIDPDTGKFDEHKVMYGYKDGPAAMEAYEKSFSDVRGFDRIGNITAFSKDKFKEWLKEGNTKKEAAPQHELPVPQLPVPQDLLRAKVGPKIEAAPANAKVFRPVHTTTARELLPHIELPTGKIPKAIAVAVNARLAKLVGDTPVHIVSDADMAKFDGSDIAGSGTLDGMWSGKTRAVYIRENVIRESVGGNPYKYWHIVHHELLHEAISDALTNNKKAVEQTKRMMSEVSEYIADNPEHDSHSSRYALTDEHEFLSEALSNPDFQKLLSRIDMSEALAKELGGSTTGAMHGFKSVWDGLVVSIRKWLGMPDGAHSMLEGALSQGDWLMEQGGRLKELRGAVGPSRGFRGEEAIRDRATDIGGSIRRTADKWLSSFRQLSYRAAAGGEQFHANARSLVDAVSRMHQEATKILGEKGGEKVVRDIAEFERAHGTEALNQVAKVGFEASNINVNLGKSADNTHLGKDVANNVQAKERLPGLQQDFDALHPEGQALLQSVGKYFRDMQNELSLQHITNILDHAGVNEPGLAQRIHQDGLTDADRQKFATDSPVRALNRVREFKRLQGLYLPFRRYGDFVVNGRHDFATPRNATRLEDGRVVFADPANNGGDKPARDAALNWARTHDLTHIDTNKISVSKTDHSVVLPADDVNAVPAYAIRLQDQHTEFHESQSAAQRRADELREDGLKDVSVELRREMASQNPGMMGGDMAKLLSALTQQTRFKNAPKNIQEAMKQALTEAVVSAQGSTKIQSRFLQRRNVSGFSQDLGKVTAEYAKTSARYLAKLRHQPEVDAAFAAMDKTIADLRHQNNGQALRRSELRQAFDQMVHSEPPQARPATMQTVAQRLLQFSRLDKLAGVSFPIINIQEPITTSIPVIGGRHGFIPTTRVMTGMYSLLGARGALANSLRDTAGAYSRDFGFTDYVKSFKDNILKSPALGGDKARRYSEVLDHIRDRGLFNDDSIFEIGKHANPSSNALGRGLDRADLMASQVNRAVEGINRAVTSLTAYEMEYRRTGNHEGAMHYALETVDKTMGDYASWNTSPLLRKHPLLAQFKKFGQKTYYLLGSTLRGALAGDTEAMRQFAGLIATHAVVAGAMGLPLEPFKVALIAANALGLTGYTWNDFEQVVREKSAQVLGKKGGEIFSHGVYRGLGIESSARQGLDQLALGFPPRSNKPNDLWAYLGQTAFGAPASYLMDQVKMSQALMKGDYAQAAELAVPLKAASDAIKAARGVTPTTNDRGQETQRAMTPYEMGVRAIGFTPSAVAEQGERRAQAGRLGAQQRQERQEFESKWAAAKPYDRMLMWGRIEQWNKDRPREAQLTRSQLDTYTRSQTKTNATAVDGIRPTKQTKDILGRVSVYNN